MPTVVFCSQAVENAARHIAGVLRAVARERRLILCRLVELGEAMVNALAGSIRLSRKPIK